MHEDCEGGGGSLDELAEKLMELMAGWAIPDGSLVLIGSMSHLALTGLAAYIEDLCVVVDKIALAYNMKISIAPAPFILSGNVEDSTLIRSMADLYAWYDCCLKQVDGMASSAFRVALEAINYSSTGETQPASASQHRLPSSLVYDKRRIWASYGLTGLPASIRSFTDAVEAEIVGRLIEDLNNFMALDLQPDPDYNRVVEKVDIGAIDSTTFILIGGSHALNLAHGLCCAGRKAIAATVGGWRPSSDLIPPMIRKIEKALSMCPDKDTVVAVLQMYDNSFYFTRTEDGNMVHLKRGKDDKFHVVGESVLAPKKMHYNAFKQSLQVLEAVKDVKKIVLSPLPRYWDSSCCDNPTHVTNRKEEGYKKRLESTV